MYIYQMFPQSMCQIISRIERAPLYDGNGDMTVDAKVRNMAYRQTARGFGLLIIDYR